MTHEEMMRALLVERFGTPGVLRAERPESPADEWQRLKELAKAVPGAKGKRKGAA